MARTTTNRTCGELSRRFVSSPYARPVKQKDIIIVDGFVSVRESDLDNLREQVWAFAMDQRVFGPRKLMVAFANADGRFLGLAYTDRTECPLISFAACLDYLGKGAGGAVALCDEPVLTGPPSQDSLERFAQAREIADHYDIHLVDWISCDDEQFRAIRLMTLTPSEQPDWWDVPQPRPRR